MEYIYNSCQYRRMWKIILSIMNPIFCLQWNERKIILHKETFIIKKHMFNENTVIIAHSNVGIDDNSFRTRLCYYYTSILLHAY